MRKKEKQVPEKSAIEAIIHRSAVCRLGMADGKTPYVIPLNFGYRDNTLYFHTGHKGKKIDILRANNRVCFEVDINPEITTSENPCKWGMKYQSVVGYGTASLVHDPEEKKKALNIIMAHYGGNPAGYPKANLARTLIIRVDIESMTGRQTL